MRSIEFQVLLIICPAYHDEIFVYPRPGDAMTFEHPNIKLIDAPLLDISATFIRKSILAGKSVKYLLPEGVADYIRDKKLYL